MRIRAKPKMTSTASRSSIRSSSQAAACEESGSPVSDRDQIGPDHFTDAPEQDHSGKPDGGVGD